MATTFKELESFYEESGEYGDGRIEYTTLGGYEIVCNDKYTADVVDVRDGEIVNIYDEEYGMLSVSKDAKFVVYEVTRTEVKVV